MTHLTPIPSLAGHPRVGDVAAEPSHVVGFMPAPWATIADVDRLLAWHALPVPEMAYLAREGITLPPGRYCKAGGAVHEAANAPGITWTLTTLDLDRTIDELCTGATLSLTGVQRQLPQVEALLRDFSQQYTAECSANLYLSGPGAEGGLHHDLHDVVVVQLSGTKRWQVHEPNPGWRDPSTMGLAGPEHGVFELEVGDALHLPAGWPHRVTTPTDGWSLHLSVGMQPLTAERLGLYEVLAVGEPGVLDRDALRDPVRFSEALVGALEKRPLATAEALRARAVGVVYRPGPAEGRLLANCGAFSLSSTARLVPRGVPWELEPLADGFVLHARNGAFRLPAGADVVLGPLFDGQCLDASVLIQAIGSQGATLLAKLLTADGLVRCEDVGAVPETVTHGVGRRPSPQRD